MKATEELYELRNYYTAENLIYRELGQHVTPFKDA